MLKHIAGKPYILNLFVIFIFLFSQVSYGAVSYNSFQPLNPVNLSLNPYKYGYDPLGTIISISPGQNQCSGQSSIPNYDKVNAADKVCSSSCGNGSEIIKPTKIFINPNGRVLTSTTPNIKEGQNLFNSWKNSNISNFYGENFGPISAVTPKILNENEILLFNNESTNQFGLLRTVWTSVKNSGIANAQPVDQIEIAVFDSRHVPPSECELATECVLKALTGTLFPEVGICKFEGICKKACEAMKISLKEIAEAAFFGTCSSVAAIIKAEATDGASIIVSIIIAAVGCALGCVTPLIHVDLDKVCKDINKIEDDVAKAYCAVYPEATQVSITEGMSTGIGSEGNDAQLSISGKFKLENQVDLANSKIRIDSLLNETMGTGELIRENSEDEESFLLPYFLHQNIPVIEIAQTDSDTFIYETPDGITPYFIMVIERTGPDENSYTFTLDASGVSAPNTPALCDENTLSTEVMTKFLIDDQQNTPTSVQATEQWDCDSVKPEMLSIGLEPEPDTIASGCALAGKGTKTSSDLFLLFVLFPLVFRLRKFRKRK